jgi:hypothetical protein
MAKTTSVLAGDVVVPAEQVNELVRIATGLPTTFFVSVGKAKVENNGNLICKFTASTESAPPPPA